MKKFLFTLLIASILTISFAHKLSKPSRTKGDSSYDMIVISRTTPINRNSVPLFGTANILIEKSNKVNKVQSVGYPDVDINPDWQPKHKGNGIEMVTGDIYGHVVKTSLRSNNPTWLAKVY